MSWDLEYKMKLRTADEALHSVQSGMRVYIQPGCAEPETLVEALMRRAPEVQDVEIVHMMTMGAAPYVAPAMAGHFRHNAMFIGGNVREAINFYQIEGLLHGRPQIEAMDPKRTTILGNFVSSYKSNPVSCTNYPWIARVFMKSHIEIENDPSVWGKIASLIQAKLN